MDTSREGDPPELPIERYARLDVTPFKMGQSIYFCPNCDWQLTEPGAICAPQCPHCASALRYVRVSRQLLDIQATVRKAAGANDLTTDERFRLVAMRSAILPKHVQGKIQAEMKNFGSLMEFLVDKRQAGAAERIAEFSITMIEAMVSVAEHIYTEAASRPRIVLS